MQAGSRVPVLLSAALIYEGKVAVGAVGIFTDLREQMRMEQSLAQAQEQLLAQERQAIIAELAGAAAHELNQPLTSVMGYAELLHASSASRRLRVQRRGGHHQRGRADGRDRPQDRQNHRVRNEVYVGKRESSTWTRRWRRSASRGATREGRSPTSDAK